MNGGQLDGYGWSVWVEPAAPIVGSKGVWIMPSPILV